MASKNDRKYNQHVWAEKVLMCEDTLMHLRDLQNDLAEDYDALTEKQRAEPYGRSLRRIMDLDIKAMIDTLTIARVNAENKVEGRV